jgi:hypothetical protein
MRATCMPSIALTLPSMAVCGTSVFAVISHHLSRLTLTQFPLREPDSDLLFRISTSSAQVQTFVSGIFSTETSETLSSAIT